MIKLEYTLTGWKAKPTKTDAKEVARCISTIKSLADLETAPCHDDAKAATEALQRIYAFIEENAKK